MMQNQNVIDLFQQIAGNQFGYFSRLGKVRDVMSKDPVPTISCDDSFGELINRLALTQSGQEFSETVKSLAIVDPCDNEMVGVLQRSTALRFYPKQFKTLSEQDNDRDILSAGIASLATRPIPQVKPDSDLLQTLNLLVDQPFDFLLVIDQQDGVLGCITPMDFVRVMSIYFQVYQQAKPLQRLRLADISTLPLDELFYHGAQTARDVMSPPVRIGGAARIADAITLFNNENVSHLLVVDEQGRDAKVISRDNILLAMHPPANYQFFDFENPFPRMDELVSEEVDNVLVDSVDSLAGEPSFVASSCRFSSVLEAMLGPNESAFFVKEGDVVQGVVTTKTILKIFHTLLQLGQWRDES